MAEAKIVPLSEIEQDQLNANKHSERGNAMLRNSMAEFGFAEAGTLDRHNRIIGGNHRTEVSADVLGADEAIVIEVDGKKPVFIKRSDIDLSTKEGRKLAYYLNRTAQVSIDWDPERLLADVNAGVELGNLFRDDELAGLLGDLLKDEIPKDSPPQVDKAEELQKEWGTELGQLWQLGPHRVVCGDCTDRGVVERVMGGEVADCLIGDPPYGMNLDTSYSNSVDNPKKNIKASRGYNRVIGDNEPFDPSPLFELFAKIPEQFYWGADYYRGKLPDGGSWLVWDKRTSVEYVQYSSSEFELCWSKKPHHRFILRVPWFGIIGTEQQDIQMRLHPTQKPLGVITPIMEKYGGNIILDPFLGSGTTMVVAHKLGKRCFGVEIDPGYVGVILQRYFDLTGDRPELVTDG